MMNSNNILSFTNVPCSFYPHQNEIILEFLSRWWISTIFDHWPASDVLFLSIKMRRFQNFFQNDGFQKYFIIDPHPMSFFSSLKRHHFIIPLTIMNFNNISAFTNVECSFPLHQNKIILQFVWRPWISTIFQNWSMSDVLSIFIKTTSF